MDDQSTLRINGGMDVVGSDGEKLGTVDRVEGNYVVASKGFFFPTDYYIPVDAISNVAQDQVYLNVTKDVALDQGWDSMQSESSDSTAYADDTTMAAPVSTPMGGTVDDSFKRQSDRGQVRGDDSETMKVPLTEEELTATKRTVDRGAVQVQKNVVEEEQTLDVPVTEERVNVTRRTVDRDVAAGDTDFQGGTIEVPVHGEEVDVQKQARVREELEISKESVGETKQVTDTVRREEARVTDDSGTAKDDTGSVKRDKPSY